MKKTIYSILFVASVLASSSCMKVDNFDAPEAHVTGRIIDSTTGENILADQGECRVRIWEKSFSLNPANQDIPVKQDGTSSESGRRKSYDVLPSGCTYNRGIATNNGSPSIFELKSVLWSIQLH